MDITTYLMWIGSDNYTDINTWVKEVEELGVSKRLPNMSVASAIIDDDPVVFVAHDEGNWEDCDCCLGIVENPDWRKKTTQWENVNVELCALEDEKYALEAILENEPSNLVESKRLVAVKRLISRRKATLVIIEDDMSSIDETIEGGTGGSVVVVDEEGDEEKIDYRKFDYWHHQPEKFQSMWTVKEKTICKACGGKGRMPVAMVFGLFVPTDVEYVLKDEDTKEVEKEMKSKGYGIVTTKQLAKEVPRKCGYRHKGGVYVVSSNNVDKRKQVKKLVKEMVSAGIVEPDGCEIKGNFIKFIKPVVVDNLKRFRGIKRWDIADIPAVRGEAEMIMDALE